VGPSYRAVAGVQILSRKGAILGVVRLIEKHWESLTQCMQQWINNDMTARLLQPTAMLPTGRCHIMLSPVKNPPLRYRLLSKFFDHFLLYFKFACVQYTVFTYAIGLLTLLCYCFES